MQIKRSVVPKFWPIERKTKKYALTPSPGPHPKDACIPLGIILRDMLHYTQTAKESQTLLNSGSVKIDGRIRKSKNFPVGLMDILTIGEENYRILPNAKGFYLQRIDDNEARIKPEKIVSKTTIRKGKVQLNLSDGHNILADKGDYGTGDTVIVETQKNTIKQLIKMKKGALVIVIGGKNAGKIGRVDDIVTVKMHPAQVTIGTEAQGRETTGRTEVRQAVEKIIVPRDYIFVIGEKEAAIKIGE